MSLFSDLAPTDSQIASFQGALKFAQTNPNIINLLATDTTSASLALTAQKLVPGDTAGNKNYSGLAIIGGIFIGIGILISYFLIWRK